MVHVIIFIIFFVRLMSHRFRLQSISKIRDGILSLFWPFFSVAVFEDVALIFSATPFCSV